MTIVEKAREIKAGGMVQADLFRFFASTKRDIVDHLALFEPLGCDADLVWDMYEEWQTA